MVYAIVKFVAVCTKVAWFSLSFLTSLEALMRISDQRFWLMQIHIWICLIQDLRMHPILKFKEVQANS